MAKRIIFPFDQKGLFLESDCMQSALEQGVSLSSLDVRKANVILDISSKMFEVPRGVIVEYGRKREACFGRVLFAYTLLSMTGLPLNCVGGFLNGRDHSTVNSMLKSHYQNISSKDRVFDAYKNAVTVMGPFMEKTASESCFDMRMSVVTEKERIADLVRFARIFGIAQPSEEAVKNYVSMNPF